MTANQYVKHGKLATDHLGPINATMFIATGTLLPIMDFIRPYFPYINYLAGAVVFFFVVLFVIKVLKVPSNRVIPSSMVFCAGVCAVAFSVGALASSKHANQGGFIAAKSEDARALQSTLLSLEKQTADINNKLDSLQAGKSTDPRVELKNIGVEWSEVEFGRASKRGDLRVVELFLQGGMPIYSIYSDKGESLALHIVNGDYPKKAEQFALLKKYGVNLDDKNAMYSKPDATTPPNLYFYALESGKKESAQALADAGVKTEGYEEWKRNKPVVKHIGMPSLL
jgi:hypothetical protein